MGTLGYRCSTAVTCHLNKSALIRSAVAAVFRYGHHYVKCMCSITSINNFDGEHFVLKLQSTFDESITMSHSDLALNDQGTP